MAIYQCYMWLITVCVNGGREWGGRGYRPSKAEWQGLSGGEGTRK